jgi:hypothetical protein
MGKGREGGMSGTYGFVVYLDGPPVFCEVDCVGGTAVECACIVDEDTAFSSALPIPFLASGHTQWVQYPSRLPRIPL